MHVSGIATSRAAAGEDDHDAQRCWVGRASVKGTGWVRMVLVTSNLLGMQLVWSTEMGLAGPYLLSLGVSKSVMAMVFLAGPLSGVLRSHVLVFM
jgi:solute carrier family 45 protein 1/2/4